ncbi:hypothetical protein WG66_003297 [Moniliophthora roreri]|nr:hypothetical protein WG66_003297 [Moniliophthora roreri]
MAPTTSYKSAKARGAKRTYMEREVVALYQATHNKRIRSVHQSTLRTLVRDNAEARHDVLGPHWKKFSTKALKQLKEREVIAPDPNHTGKVVFTPKGKSIISDAQRDLNIRGTPTVDQEDRLARYVAAVVKGRSKRAGSRITDYPRKRPRRSGKTKAELEEELRQAKEALQEAESQMSRLTVENLLRSTSPLSDLSDEEDDEEQVRPARSNESNEDIDRFKKLIMRLQQELAEARHASPSVYHGDSPMYSGMVSPGPLGDDDEDEDDDDAAYVHLNLSLDDEEDDEDEVRTQIDDTDADQGRLVNPRTPPRIQQQRPASTSGLFPRPASIPARFGVHAPIPQRPQLFHGLTRTESGSFIHPVSKRPTPSPSSPGRDEDMIMDPDATMVDGNVDLFQGGQKEAAATADGQQLPTPDTTPERPALRTNTEKDEKIAELQREVERLVGKQSEDQAKIISLSSDLTTRNAELQTKMSEIASLLDTLSFKETHITGLEAENTRFNAEIQANRVLVSGLQLQNGNLQSSKAQAETRVTGLEIDNARVSAELQTKSFELAGLQELLSSKDSRITALEAEVAELTAELQTCNGLLSDLRTQNDELQAGKLTADARAVELEGQVGRLSQEALHAEEKAEQLTVRLGEALAQATAKEASLDQQIVALTTGLKNAQSDLAARVSELQATEQQLANSLLENEEAEARVREGEQREDALRAEISAKDVENQQLQAEVQTLTNRIVVLEAALGEAQAQSAVLETDVRNQTEVTAGLRVKLDGARAQLDVVQGQLQASEDQVTLLNQLLGMEKARASDVQRQNEELEKGRARLESLAADNLSRAQEAEQEADELGDLNEKLLEDNRRLKRIADEYATEKLREADAARERAAALSRQLASVEEPEAPPRKRPRPASEYIPPVADPYEYIIFRASEVKDLAVEEPTPQPPVRNVHDDPAVIGASAPSQAPQAAYSPYVGAQVPNPAAAVAAAAYAQQQQQQQQAQQQRAAQQAQIPPRQQQPTAAQVVAGAAGNAPRAQPPRRNNAGNIQTAAASLETVERALGDLRVSNANAARGGAGGRRGNHAGPKPISVPNTDFDFESSNARFDKRALGASAKGGAESDVETNPSDNEEGKEKDKGKVRESTAYHPQKSFFDELTPGPAESRGGGRGGRRGGGPGGRNRREEERERNFATFGEAGGVGLMGPGAYVGGWGGYGRRGGRGGGVRGGRGRGRGGSAPVGVGAG